MSGAIGELRTAKSDCERISQAKDDFLAALSHELRTPLTPVLITAAVLREDERLPADVREQLAMMERNIALEARLIDDLLDLTRISRGKLEFRAQLCDAHHLIDFACEIVREDAAAKDIHIDCNLNARHSGLMTDPARFQQVIWNLLRNAVKFSPAGGTIAILTREEHTTDGETWLRIEVTDSGLGIEPARLEQIFLPFDQGSLTSDHRFGGIGLGLAIARAVVDRHGGRISAQSAGLDRGTTMVVQIPGAIPPPWIDSLSSPSVSRAADKTVLPGLTRASPSLRLLIVEDHESTRLALRRLLERDGHRVVTAATVSDGLEAAMEERFDLVISDLALPDGTGIDLMQELRAKYSLRGIAISGYGTEEDISRSHEAGFISHLIKPVQIADLRRVLAALPHSEIPIGNAEIV